MGSFLRPEAIHTARAAHLKGELDAAGLRQVEDKAIRELVKQQEAAGLRGISDGEFRVSSQRWRWAEKAALQVSGSSS